MLHRMNLHHGPFLSICSGRKDVELRLHDEKRQRILPGDVIGFSDTQTGDTLQVLVTQKRLFPDFAALYQAYDKLRIGYTEEEIPDPRDMEQFYAPEDMARWGVVAIEIQKL